jgi:hypothetical protein
MKRKHIMQFSLDADRLRVNIDTKECNLPDESRTRMQPVLERLGQAVRAFPASELWLTIVYHPRSNTFHAQAKLKLPGETIITGDRNGELDVALSHCLEQVQRRVDAYRMNPDGQAIEVAEQRAEADSPYIAKTEPDAGELGEAVQQLDYAAFRRAIAGQETHVRLHIGRWVQRYPEIERDLGREFQISDLVEEVFLLAFEQWADRPMHLPLHEWLDSLADPAVWALYRDPVEQEAASYAQSVANPPSAHQRRSPS